MIALAVWLAFTGWFYAWTATSAGRGWDGGKAENQVYNQLVEGMRQGRLSLPTLPDPRLAELADPWDPALNRAYPVLHDMSYFDGRYYVYFGPTPLLLLLPWRVMTGGFLPENLALVMFAWWGALMGGLILREAWRRWAPGAPAWFFAAGVVLVTWGNFVPVLLRRPLHYELAIASAWAMALTAMWALQKALGSDAGRRRTGWLVSAGLAYGLAVAGRPHYLFGGAMFLVWVWPEWVRWREDKMLRWREWAGRHGPWAVPLGAVIAGILVYNFARFGNPLEFGTSYVMSGMHPVRDVFTGPRFMGVNLYFYLWAPPHWVAWFPFLAVTAILPFAYPANYTGVENVYGILTALPAVWVAVGWWAVKAHRALPEGERRWMLMLAVLGAGPLFYLSQVGGAASRYMVDFAPAWLLLAAIVALRWGAAWRGWRRWAGAVGWGGLVAYSVVVTVLVSVQHNGLLAHYRPEAWQTTAARAERVTEPVFNALGGANAGARRIVVHLPTNRTGQLQPLVVTGHSFQADFLWIHYYDERRIVVGFEHTSYGGPKTAPFAVDYGADQVLEVEMGSFYPPRTHPYWDGVAAEEIERRKRTLRVTWNGRVLLEQEQDFYEASPGDVSVGRNHVSRVFGRAFSGEIVAVEVLPAAAGATAGTGTTE